MEYLAEIAYNILLYVMLCIRTLSTGWTENDLSVDARDARALQQHLAASIVNGRVFD